MKAKNRKKSSGVKNAQSGRLDKKLLAYSVAAGAALTLTPQAQAAIVYTNPADITVTAGLGNTPKFVDLDGDLTNDVKFIYTLTGVYQNIRAKGSAGNSLLWTGGVSTNVKKLALGNTISAGQTSWNASSRALNVKNTAGTVSFGSFIGSTGYIGVKFKIGATTHYGWIQYTGTAGTSGKILDWAYENTPNTAIAAGAMPPASVPTLNEWGMIILTALLCLTAAKKIKDMKEE